MDILSLTPITSTIYEPNPVTFVVDTDASTTVDIDKTKITLVDPSYCDQSKLSTVSVNPVTQAKTIFNVEVNTASNLGITPFSATVMNCGTLTNTWTYKGIDMSDGLVLDPSLDRMTVDPNSGAIQI